MAIQDIKEFSNIRTFEETTQKKKSTSRSLCSRACALVTAPFRFLQTVRGALSNMTVQDASSLGSLQDTHSRMHLETVRSILYSQHESYAIPTSDGETLDALFIKGSRKKAVLFAYGRGGFYEELGLDETVTMKNFIRFFKEQLGDVSILIPNLRGIGASTGTSTSATIPVDLQSSYKFLINTLGYQPDDVLTYGHSLGGLFGLKTAALIQKEYPKFKISAVVDRSLVDLAQLVGVKQGRVAEIAVRALFINANTQKDARSLKGHVIAYNSRLDETIPYQVSFVSQVIQRCLPQLRVVVMESDAAEEAAHVRKLSQREANEIGELMRAALKI